MGNLNVLYDRGNFALQTLTKEISATWGKPARPYEYVTGYRAADNFTGHNADINGVAHGVDIFVGPGNLTPERADELTRFLRDEGLKGSIPGHPDRLYYIIYQDRIAGDFSGWEWVGAGYGHWDHIHISTCDLFWGDPAPIGPLDYDSTAPWGLASTTAQPLSSSKPQPIQEDDMPLTPADVDLILDTPVERSIGGNITLRTFLKYSDGNFDSIRDKVKDIKTAKGDVSLRQFVANGTRAAQEAANNTGPIKRGGKLVSLRQEVANILTKVLGLEPLIVESHKVATAPDVDAPEAEQ